MQFTIYETGIMKSSNPDDPKPTSAKKLKQATLPFFALSNKGKSPGSDASKKRKKSESDSEEICVLKVLCSNKNNTTKETLPLSKIEKDDKPVENTIKAESEQGDENDPAKPETEKKIREGDENHLDKIESEECEKKEVEEVESEPDKSITKEETMESEEPENDSSPLPSMDVSAQEDTEDEEEGVQSSDVSMNISALLAGGDDKDSLNSFSDIPLTPMKTPTSGSKKPRKLTPKQIEKQKEIQKRKEEKEREKEERERKKQEEKENRKRQREEKEEQKKKEKIEKEMKRQAEIEALEKKKREEEKLQKDEEKRKADEKAAKEKEKAAAAFASFFVLKKSDSKPVSPVMEEKAVTTLNFIPFQVKVDMKLAPTTRIVLPSERKQRLEKILSSPENNAELYLQQLKSGKVKPEHQGKTWPYVEAKDDVMIIEEVSAGEAVQIGENNLKRTVHAKLLQFHENRRPPYWGTWRRKSAFVGPRRPLGIDKVQFDYEVDSDDEWEEEEPGESIKGSEDEAEKESDDDYEPPEAQKERLKMLEKEFNAEMQEKKKQLKPRILGVFFQNESESHDPVYKQLLSLMTTYAVRRIPTTITTSFNLPSEPVDLDVSGSSTGKRGARPRNVPDEAIPDLIRLIHGNTKSQNFLVKEFVTYWQSMKDPDYKKNEVEEMDASLNNPSNSKWRLISNANACRKIKELATWRTCPDEGPLLGKLCWYVPLEVRQAHGLTDLPLPNEWKYTLTLKKKVKKEEPKEEPEIIAKPVTPKTTPSGSLITKFTKKLSEEERQKQIKRKSITPLITNPPKVKPKHPFSPFSPQSAFCVNPQQKQASGSLSIIDLTGDTVTESSTSVKQEEKKGRRVSILVSVPRGQQIPSAFTSAQTRVPDSSAKDMSSSTAKVEETEPRSTAKVEVIESTKTDKVEEIGSSNIAKAETIESSNTAEVEEIKSNNTAKVEEIKSNNTAKVEEIKSSNTAKVEEMESNNTAKMEEKLGSSEPQKLDTEDKNAVVAVNSLPGADKGNLTEVNKPEAMEVD
ncbi:hypothetical protein B566_EDAN014604 [Ephemera danica]|nr:hypothetical protein B566_EDAN014604 [Ephemera danica]